jgi:hypothetical protein
MPVSPGGENINPAQSSAAVSDAPSRSPVARSSTAPRVVTQGSGINNTGSAASDLQRIQERDELNRVIAGDTLQYNNDRKVVDGRTTVGTGTTSVDNSAVDLSNAPMSTEDIALALGIPVAAAALIKASLDAVETTGKRNRTQGVIESVAADNAKLQAALAAGQSPSAAVDAANKVATDTATKPPPATATKPPPTAKTPRPPPRTAVQGVTAGYDPVEEVAGPVRDPAVVDDGKAAAAKAKSDAALKAAEKKPPVPPAKATGPVESIKEKYPSSKPVDPNAIPSKGPIEPMPSKSVSPLADLINAVRKLR